MRRVPVSIAQTMDSLLSSLGVDRIVRRHSIWACWGEIVGKEVAAHARPEFFSGTRLFVTVDHPGWMHQLTFLKERILHNINEKLGPQAVADIRFRVGPVVQGESTSGEETRDPVQLTPTERAEIDASLRSVPSHELKEILDRIMTKDRIHRKSHGDQPAP